MMLVPALPVFELNARNSDLVDGGVPKLDQAEAIPRVLPQTII